jgi:hypothetical protein
VLLNNLQPPQLLEGWGCAPKPAQLEGPVAGMILLDDQHIHALPMHGQPAAGPGQVLLREVGQVHKQLQGLRFILGMTPLPAHTCILIIARYDAAASTAEYLLDSDLWHVGDMHVDVLARAVCFKRRSSSTRPKAAGHCGFCDVWNFCSADVATSRALLIAGQVGNMLYIRHTLSHTVEASWNSASDPG